MASSLRFAESREAAAARVAREVAVTSTEHLGERIAPGGELEVDGLRWKVVLRENPLGDIVATAMLDGLLRVSAAVPRSGRDFDDRELAHEVEHELRGFIDVALERLLEAADRLRAARGSR